MPTASISAGTGNSAAFLTGTGILGTSNKQSLTLGTTATGNIVLANNTILNNNFTQTGANNFTTGTGLTTVGGNLTIGGSTLTFNNPTSVTLANNTSALNFATGLLNLDTTNGGKVGIGTTTPTAKLDVAGTASISGELALYGTTPQLQSTANQTLTIGGNTTGQVVLSGLGGTTGNGVTLAGYGIGLIHSDTNGVLTSSALNLAGGPNEVTGILPVINGGSPFEETNDAITERITTEDLLLGGTSTGSAKFAFTNVAGGTPTASISGANNNALSLSATGTLATTNGQTLQLGNASTGNINFFSGANNLTSAGNLTLANNLSIGGIIAANTSHTINGLSINAATQTLSANNFSDSGPLTIATGANGNLTLTPNGSGNTVLTSTYQSGVLIGSSSNTLAPLSISGGIGGNAAAIINQTNSGDLLTASASGITKFTVSNSGAVTTGIWNATAIATQYGGTGQNWSGVPTGSLPYFSGAGVMSTLPIGTDAQLLTVTGGLPAWVSTSSINFWQRNNGALAQLNTGDDLLLGSTATNSAKFAFTNVAGGTPTASLAGTAGATSLTANGILATTNNQTLQLGNNTTGNINFFSSSNSLTSAGNLSITGIIAANTTHTINGLSINGATQTLSANNFSDSGALTIATGANGNLTLTPNGSGYTLLSTDADSGVFIGSANTTSAPLSVSGGIGGNAAAIINQTNSGDIFTASASGNTAFTIANNGNIAATGTITGLQGITSAGTIQFTNLNTPGVVHTDGTGTLFTSAINLASGSAEVTGILPVANGGSPFDEGNGSIFERNTTEDLLLGSNATTSAAFAFTNVAAGTPTASISASTNGATYLSANGILATTNGQTLQLGDNNTGNINFFSPANSLTNSGNLSLAGNIAIGGTITANTTNTINGLSINAATQTLSAHQIADSGTLTITTGTNNDLTLTPGGSGNTILSSDFNTGVRIGSAGNTPAVLSISGGIGNNAAEIVNETNNGDIFTASASGATKFTIGNDGTLTTAKYLTNGGLLYTNGSGVVQQISSVGNSNQVLHGGTNPTFSAVNLTTDVSGILPISNGGSPFEQTANGGAITERITTQDLLLGSTATASAKFAFTNVAGGTPTASISASSGNNASFLTGAGVLGTTNKQTLQLGNASTGNINFFSNANVLDTAGNLSLAGNGTFAGTTGFTLTGANAGLTFSNNSTHIIQASAGTLQLNAFTLGGDITAATHNISNVGTLDFGTNNLSIVGTTIQTTAGNNPITITPNGSGNIVLTSTYQSGVNIGSNTSNAINTPTTTSPNSASVSPGSAASLPNKSPPQNLEPLTSRLQQILSAPNPSATSPTFPPPQIPPPLLPQPPNPARLDPRRHPTRRPPPRRRPPTPVPSSTSPSSTTAPPPSRPHRRPPGLLPRPRRQTPNPPRQAPPPNPTTPLLPINQTPWTPVVTSPGRPTPPHDSAHARRPLPKNFSQILTAPESLATRPASCL